MASTNSHHINYYRMLSLTFETSSKTLQFYLSQHYRSKGFQHFADFLSNCFHVLFFLWSKSPICACGEGRTSQYHKGKPILTGAQWNMLFDEVPEARSKCRFIPRIGLDIKCIDISLSAFILTNVCKGDLAPDIVTAITTLRDQRNAIMHRTTANMDEAEFNRTWTTTEHVIMKLAQTLPTQESDEIQRQITSIRHRFIDDAESTRFLTLLRPFIQV